MIRIVKIDVLENYPNSIIQISICVLKLSKLIKVRLIGFENMSIVKSFNVSKYKNRIFLLKYKNMYRQNKNLVARKIKLKNFLFQSLRMSI